MKILLATGNEHKKHEYQKLFEGYDIELFTAKDFNIDIDPEENGNTYEENSLIKAKAFASLTDMVVLADDTGIEIEALGKKFPGIHTKRFADSRGGTQKNNELLVKDVPGSKAIFTCCITVMNLTKEPLVFVGHAKGKIANKIEGKNGFGYDPIFILDGCDLPIACYSEEFKNTHSHRYDAVHKFIEYLKNNGFLYTI